MTVIREYKTAQISTFTFNNELTDEILKQKFENKLALYNLVQIPQIVEDSKGKFLFLAFNKQSCVRKIGFNCTPNGIGKILYIAQDFITVNDETVYLYEEFKIGKTGILEVQVEKILLPDKELGTIDGELFTNIYSVKLPLSYTYNENKISKIDFVFDYAYEVTN